MKVEPTFEELSAKDIVSAIIADDPDLQDYEADLLNTIQQMKNGDYSKARITHIQVSPIVETRNKAQLSQPKFAEKLGISVNTLRSWEQGLRKPSGAAKTLLDLLHRRPELIHELHA
ncbi:helix-turn-helix domain-containing protein [Rodentibacter caecimuris]|uniref:helix-turn-helix domain-containing protein n=1 Tax=Rodentibacter caecimuris TaxID=1796644 RepID=UPI00211A3597|nr:type II toxin-antitoxin system MqsA family antitoxin [Rodentibacter heylii]MCQ9123154.1 type II toxin-antitoxin system MqsA family antitoxin [Rodentibacter heylii]